MSLRAASLQHIDNSMRILGTLGQEFEFLSTELNGPEPITRSGLSEVLEGLAALQDAIEVQRSTMARLWLSARAIQPMASCRHCGETLASGETFRGTCADCHSHVGEKCTECGVRSLIMTSERDLGLCWNCRRARLESCHSCGEALHSLSERDAGTCADCARNIAQKMEA